MVELVLGVKFGLCSRGETSDNFQILPGMLTRFNQNMYNHKRALATPKPAANEASTLAVKSVDNNQVNELKEFLNDVEVLLGEFSLLVNWLCIYSIVKRLFYNTVFPIPQRLSYTAASILYHTYNLSLLQYCLLYKTLAVKLYKVMQVSFKCN